MSIEEFGKQLDGIYSALQQGLQKNSRNYAWRISQLQALKKMLTDHEQDLNQAMWEDLRKSPFECQATEHGLVLSEIEHALDHLKEWMQPERVSTPLYNLPGRSEILREPLGLTLIIGAWNYPINLLLAPLVGAIAGGNGAILKPSELAVHTANLLSRIVPKFLDPTLFAVVQAGPEETGVLLEKKFNLIFFTGSGPVGKIVMTKAAQNLTPVVLELGGKSPAMVLKDADIEVAARRIVWGKFMNAGQTCVAPDYVMVHPSVREALIEALKKCLHEFYGANPKASPDYCRIINGKNFDRLMALIEPSAILHGGQNKRDELYIEPTLVSAKVDSLVMHDEIFGPVLPILDFEDVGAMIQFINSRPKPLALYLFTASEASEQQVLAETSSGGVCINDVIMHMPVAGFPFGGVGASGMGHYHGRFSFTAFTHAKAVLRKATWLDIPVRYPPYSATKSRWLRRLFQMKF